MPIISSLTPLDQNGQPDFEKMIGKIYGHSLPETDEEFFKQEILPNLQGKERKEISQIVLSEA